VFSQYEEGLFIILMMTAELGGAVSHTLRRFVSRIAEIGGAVHHNRDPLQIQKPIR